MDNKTRVVFSLALVIPTLLLVFGSCHVYQEDSMCSVVDIKVSRDPTDISGDHRDPVEKWFVEIHARSVAYSDPVDGLFVVTSGKNAFTDAVVNYFNVAGFRRACTLRGDGLLVPKYVTVFDGIHTRGHAQNWAVAAIIVGGILVCIWFVSLAMWEPPVSPKNTHDYERLSTAGQQDHSKDGLYSSTDHTYRDPYIEPQ